MDALKQLRAAANSGLDGGMNALLGQDDHEDEEAGAVS